MKKNRKILTIFIVLIIVTIIIFATTLIDRYEDTRICQLPYRNSCTIILNKPTSSVYFVYKRSCEEVDCNLKRIDTSNCKSKKKTYFKKISKEQYVKIKEEINSRYHNSFPTTCDNLKKIITN